MASQRRVPRDRGKDKSSRNTITVQQVEGEGVFEFVYPRCVQAREEDMAEVRAMLEAGEVDVAEEELRWLLEGCRDLLEAHKLLGDIAMADGDLKLARGHLGYAYDMGLAAIPPGGLPSPLDSARPANRPFFEAGKALAECLGQLGEAKAAREVIERIIALDPKLDLEGVPDL